MTVDDAIAWTVENARTLATYDVCAKCGTVWENDGKPCYLCNHDRSTSYFNEDHMLNYLAGGLLGVLVGSHQSGQLDRTHEALDKVLVVYQEMFVPMGQRAIEREAEAASPPTATPPKGQMTPGEVEAFLKEHEEDERG